MTKAAETTCEMHPDRFDCPDALAAHFRRSGFYGIIIHDGGGSFAVINYCPWCGADLRKQKEAQTSAQGATEHRTHT